MALIYCPECKKEISDKASVCPNCGFPISDYLNDSNKAEDNANKQIICQFCGQPNDIGSLYCGYCGELIDTAEIERRIEIENLKMQSENIRWQKEQYSVQQQQLKEQQQIRKQQEKEYKHMAKCPRCGSTSLSSSKKGFGIGKAVVGTALIGPLGLMAGNLGAKKVRVTCMKCGKQFWA